MTLPNDYPAGKTRGGPRFEAFAQHLLNPEIPDQELIDFGEEIGFTVADLNRALASWSGSYQALAGFPVVMGVAASKVAKTLRDIARGRGSA